MSYAFMREEPRSSSGGVIPCICIREHPNPFYANFNLGGVYPAFYESAGDLWVVHFDTIGRGKRLVQEYMLAREHINERPVFTFLSNSAEASPAESPWLLPVRSYEDMRIGELMVDCEANRDDSGYVAGIMSTPLWKAHFSDDEFCYMESGTVE